MASDPTIIETSIEVLMKSDASVADCPDETRCQLELFENSEDENPSLIVEDTGDALVKNLQVFMKSSTGGCDYALNIGMVGGMPTEYILFYHYGRGRMTNVLFDIGSGSVVNIGSYESKDGSPAKPALPRAIVSQNDAEWSTWRAWFEYNFETSGVAWDSEHPYPYPLDYSYSEDVSTTCAGVNYIYDASSSEIIEDSNVAPMAHVGTRVSRCTTDSESYTLESQNNRQVGGTAAGSYSQDRLDVRNNFLSFILSDNISGENYTANIRASSFEGIDLDFDLSGLTYGICESYMKMDFYENGSLKRTHNNEHSILCNLDGSNSVHTGTGSHIRMFQSGSDYEVWYFQASVGELYACTLGGGFYQAQITQGADRSRWFW